MRAAKRCALSVCVLAALLLGAARTEVRARTIEDVRIQDSEVEGACQAIEGQYGVSIQAAVQYKMSGKDGAGSALYGNPDDKQ